MSSKSPFSLSRQGTLRSSHSRKNSTTHTLNLTTGRRSPQQLSPSGRRSPVFLMYDGNRSPLDLLEQRKSPTTNPMMFPHKSPSGDRLLGFGDFDRRSPTSTVHVQDQKSPTAVLLGFDDGRRSPTIQVQGRRSPIGFSQGLITCIPIVTPSEKKSPIGMNTLHIPPITVSNPSETCAIIEKTFESSTNGDNSSPITEIIVPTNVNTSAATNVPQSTPSEQTPRKEQRSVMREILAFVRKPSKKATTRTGKFAAAFSRAESNQATPLMRQSTFSSSPAASSRAAKSAVTKQISEISFEPKMSLKILNSKMSIRLRRTIDKAKDKKSSGDEMSDRESSDSKPEKINSSSSDVPFEFESVRFQKVGESYIKHDKIREETLEDTSPSPVQTVGITDTIEQHERPPKASTPVSDDSKDKTQQQLQSQADDRMKMSDVSASVDSIKEDGINIDGGPLKQESTGSCTDEKVGILKSTLENLVLKPEAIYATETKAELNIQCPTFEIMPPSRRSSFDPPRSPYLENLRSPCDTDPEMILNRLDSAGDSFEMVDTDRNRESSFESRYPSSSHTSFDISRYQSTSCEDQTSSFEIIDIDNQKSGGSGSGNDDKTTFDLRKSSIELVDVETFQKSSSTAGRKSSLETHFDFEMPGGTSRLSTPKTKKQISEPNSKCLQGLSMKTHHSAPHRTRSPLSQQTSSNYSSRDSHDSNYPPSMDKRYQFPSQQHPELKSPKQHFPILMAKSSAANAAATGDGRPSFICTDQRCASIFEPPHQTNTSPYLSSHLTSSSEFEPPSPRRAASASPKHTFTFRIVLKKGKNAPHKILRTCRKIIFDFPPNSSWQFTWCHLPVGGASTQQRPNRSDSAAWQPEETILGNGKKFLNVSPFRKGTSNGIIKRLQPYRIRRILHMRPNSLSFNCKCEQKYDKTYLQRSLAIDMFRYIFTSFLNVRRLWHLTNRSITSYGKQLLRDYDNESKTCWISRDVQNFKFIHSIRIFFSYPITERV